MGKYFISQIKTSEKFKNKNIEKKKLIKFMMMSMIIILSFLSQNQKSHTEESPSEISGETIPSDSGHGGSEEDFNSHNHNNNMGKYLTSPCMDSNTSTY